MPGVVPARMVVTRDKENSIDAGGSQRETNFIRKNFFIAGEILSDDARQARIGISKTISHRTSGRGLGSKNIAGKKVGCRAAVVN
jgi:hypothetical protein